MIRFVCLHCGRAVCVDDSAAGKKGRCPLCKGLVDIPSESEDICNPDKNSGTEAGPPHPPTTPNSPHPGFADELDLLVREPRSMDETDVLPAMEPPLPEKKDPYSFPRAPSHSKSRTNRRWVLIAAVVVLATFIVAAIALLALLGKFI